MCRKIHSIYRAGYYLQSQAFTRNLGTYLLQIREGGDSATSAKCFDFCYVLSFRRKSHLLFTLGGRDYTKLWIIEDRKSAIGTLG